MTGDDRARFCGSCDRHVYNIVDLSRSEIESLIENTEGRLCVRMYQRSDATVLTQDCRVGLRTVRKRLATFAGAALSALLGLVSVGYGQDTRDQSRSNVTVERTKRGAGKVEITGFVTDRSGAVIADVVVELKGVGFEKKERTDNEGRFRFAELEGGIRYELSLEHNGFIKHLITDLDPASGDVLAITVRMKAQESQPHAPVELNLSPVVIDPDLPSWSMSTQRVDPCSNTVPIPERMKINSKSGQIAGVIIDMLGAVVPGIKIKLQLKSRVVARVTSTASGTFAIPDLKPDDNYTLLIESQQGWKKQAIEKISLSAGERVSYGLCLQTDNVYEVVGIFAGSETLSAEPIQPTGIVVSRPIYPLPGKSTRENKPKSKRKRN